MRPYPTLSLAVALVLPCLHSRASAESSVVDDFDDLADDGWVRSSFGAGKSYGPPIYDTSGGAYRLGTTGEVPPGEGGFVSSTWSGDVGDGFVRFSVRIDSPDTGAGVMLRYGAPPFHGYDFFINTACSCFGIERCDASGNCPQVSFVPGATVAVGELWNVEIGAVDDQLTMKVWRAGEAEPPAPQLAVRDGRYVSGKLHLIVLATFHVAPVKTDVTFDDFVFTPAEDLCPRPALDLDTDSGPAPLEVSATAADPVIPDGVPVDHWRWDFGDGSPVAEGPDLAEVTHGYADPGTYEVSAEVAYSNGCSRRTTRSVTVTCPPGDSAPWATADVGDPRFPGSADRDGDGDVLTLCASGAGIRGGGDALHLVHQEIAGDFDLVVKVPAPPAGASPGAELGLIVRESLDPSSRTAAMLVTRISRLGTGDLRFVSRAGPQEVTSGDKVGFPLWLRLQRRGDIVAGSHSPTGDTADFEDLQQIDFDDPELGEDAMPLSRSLLFGVFAANGDLGGGTPRSPVLVLFEALAVRDPEDGRLPRFIRGDCNGDGAVSGTVTDAVFLLSHLFLSNVAVPLCEAACDANADARLDLSDAVAVLAYSFTGGAAPPAPFPDCGTAPGPGALSCGEEAEACR